MKVTFYEWNGKWTSISMIFTFFWKDHRSWRKESLTNRCYAESSKHKVSMQKKKKHSYQLVLKLHLYFLQLQSRLTCPLLWVIWLWKCRSSFCGFCWRASCSLCSFRSLTPPERLRSGGSEMQFSTLIRAKSSRALSVKKKGGLSSCSCTSRLNFHTACYKSRKKNQRVTVVTCF